MRQRDGTVVALCYFDPATPYSVRLDPAGLPVGEDGAAITLKRADPAEIEKFWRFQSLLSIDQRTAFPLVADAVRLADASPALKERFEAVFKHAETMLDDAIHVMEDEEFKPLVMKMAAKLFGMPADEAAHEDLYPMLNVIWGHLMKMRESMPYLKEQSPHVIGFFQDAQASGGSVVTGNAFIKSMLPEISWNEMNKPLISLAESYFKDPLKILNNQAAIHSPDVHTYTRTATNEDFSAMLGLLGDIVDRSKRAPPVRTRDSRFSDRS